ncbi:MAG: MBL fold metallo-hydrolase [Planctomycetota bacterium]|jgi:L-ascorbate metabolism protein UlaG (beta-lactamase superfamily)
MRGLSLFIPGLVLLAAISGCKKDAAAPSPGRDAAVQEQSRKETNMGLSLKWLGHASFRISDANTVVYIDPWKLEDSPGDADFILVSHSHYDHHSSEDIKKVSGDKTVLIASNDVVIKEEGGQTLMPGLKIELGGIGVKGVPAYNPNKQFHPKSNQWLGFVIEIGGKRIYYAGDTDLTDEMKALSDIDVALLPVGGTYTMNAAEAAEAASHIKPELAVPYHWGDIVGGESDAKSFAEKAACEAKVIHPGESISL